MKNGWKFYAGLGLTMGFLGVFLVYPVLYVIQGSVLVEDHGKTRFTLIFFQLFSQSPLMWKCLLNSFFLAALTTLICSLIALPLAHLFAAYDFPFKPFWQTLRTARSPCPGATRAIWTTHAVSPNATKRYAWAWWMLS